MHKILERLKPLVKRFWWAPGILFLGVLIAWMFILRLQGNSWHEGTGFSGKTVWDWMQLFIIPVVLAFGALWFNKAERENENKIANKRNENEQEISNNRMRESVLQTYIDRMTELLLDKCLLKSESDSEVRDVARTRTLTTLRMLDPERKGLLLRFLREAGLIQGAHPIINLSEADLGVAFLMNARLSGVNLSGAYMYTAFLGGADLRKAYLNGTNLYGAHLDTANLMEAHLVGADLSDARLFLANLSGADLRGAIMHECTLDGTTLTGAIMPDGTVHE